jgi:hypothetical protein
MIRKLMTLGAILLGTGGCASLFSPGPDFVAVGTMPPGAKIRLDGVPVGFTPMLLPIDRRSDGVLSFELAGYQTETVDLDKVLNGWFVANVLWLPVWPVVPLGMAIDLMGSNQGKYSRRPVQVELKKLEEPVRR